MTASLRALLEEGARTAPDRRVVDDLTWAQLHVQAQRLEELNINYRHTAIDTPEPSLLQ